MSDAIKITCDAPNPRHPKKRPEVIVTVFVPASGGWTERNVSPRRQEVLQGRSGGLPDSGVTLIGDRRPTAEDRDDPEAFLNARSVYSLECPYCVESLMGGPYQYRQETLFAALDKARQAGAGVLSLSQVDAIVQHMAGFTA